jgi:hypothetical protein
VEACAIAAVGQTAKSTTTINPIKPVIFNNFNNPHPNPTFAAKERTRGRQEDWPGFSAQAASYCVSHPAVNAN